MIIFQMFSFLCFRCQIFDLYDEIAILQFLNIELNNYLKKFKKKKRKFHNRKTKLQLKFLINIRVCYKSSIVIYDIN